MEMSQGSETVYPLLPRNLARKYQRFQAVSKQSFSKVYSGYGNLHRTSKGEQLCHQISPSNIEEMDKDLEENVKIVEMAVCESKDNSRSRNSMAKRELSEERFSAYSSNGSYTNEENCKASSPAPSTLTELSPRACSVKSR